MEENLLYFVNIYFKKKYNKDIDSKVLIYENVLYYKFLKVY